ncbi:MAG: amidophosphoribosyltransferase [Actinobacteria bacterium]|nr:MAG: amidophosphoribosyltransferase [Actinomycetota bacterium]
MTGPVTIAAQVGAESPKEECGLFGVWAPGEDVSRLTYFGLFAQQHRGQESAGMAVSDGQHLLVFKELGLVSQVFNEATLRTLQGDLGIGHTRYSTTGSTTWENAQPAFKTDGERSLALGHNGNLVNTAELAERSGRPAAATTDSDLVAGILARRLEAGLWDASLAVLPDLRGAFCFVMMDERSLYAARDPYGLRPLSIGKLPNGYCVASETCALDIVGATFIRDVEPGELIRIDDRGPRSASFAESPRKALCIFEFVYLARADSRIQGTTVHEVRRKLGRRLAVEAPTQADMVIPVPDTGHSAAQGYAEVSGIPYGEGLMKNRYVGRTFIQPSQSLRERGVKLKLNPIPDAIRGKRLVVIDDSIVRGTTTRQIVQALREAGAAEVHTRITCPPIKWPCFYGIDMPTRHELVASDLSVEEIRRFVGADSLGYLSLDGMVAATGAPKDDFCRACFDGEYPIEVPEGAGKFLLEQPARS